MEFGTLERQIYIDAAPDIVYDVVSSPHHVKQWWPDEATYEPVPGSTGQISFGDKVEAFTVITADPPRTFTFRWTQPTGETPVEGNSLQVTFDLTPTGDGTLLTLTETGFREMGWETAILEEMYHDHESGWDYFIPRLNTYVNTQLAVRP